MLNRGSNVRVRFLAEVVYLGTKDYKVAQQAVTEILQNVGGITFDGWLLIRGKLEWSQSLLYELSQLILANLISGIVRIMLYHLSYLSCFREERHNACDWVG